MISRCLKFLSCTLLILCCLLSVPADAAKKDKNADAEKEKAKIEAEVKAAVEPLDQQLNTLMLKIQSRGLFSPSDAGKLADAKYKVFDLMDKYPTHPLILKPVYQAGMLLSERGEYQDSYEMLSFLSAQFAQTSYGSKARIKIMQLEKQFGKDYFPKHIEPSEEKPTTSEKATSK